MIDEQLRMSQEVRRKYALFQPRRRHSNGPQPTSPVGTELTTFKETDNTESMVKYTTRRRSETVSVRDKFGFLVENQSLHEACERHQEADATRSAIQTTAHHLASSPNAAASAELHSLLLNSGIPDAYRRTLWYKFSGAAEIATKAQQDYTQIIKQKADVPQDSLKAIDKGITLYSAPLKHPNSTPFFCTDMDRTFPLGTLFDKGEKTRQELHNVLCAFSLTNSDGYCQGLNFIAGVMLLFMTEAETYWVLCRVVNGDRYNAKYYGMDMSMCALDQAVLEKLMSERHPAVLEKIVSLNASVTDLVVKWFLCVFVDCFPLPSTLLLWDFYFMHGITFTFSVVLAFFDIFAEKIVACEDLGSLMSLVKEGSESMVDPLPMITTALHKYKLSFEDIVARRRACEAALQKQNQERDRMREELRKRRENNNQDPLSPQDDEKKGKLIGKLLRGFKK